MKKFEIKGDVLIFRHTQRNPDQARQFKNISKKNNMKGPTLDKEFNNQFFNFFNVQEEKLTEDKVYQVIDKFFIDLNKFKQHIEKIQHFFKVEYFQGEAFTFKNIDDFEGKIWGDLSVSLRDVNRTEIIIQFGKHTPIRKYDNTNNEEAKFETLIFGGLFGGEINNINYNFVEIHINRKTKEIYHFIDEEKLQAAVEAIYNDENNIFNSQDSIEVFDELDQLMYLDFNEDTRKILLERSANLSKIHNEMQDKIASMCLLKKVNCKNEFLNRIDIWIERQKAYLLEIKTSASEIYKAIGQVLVYENLVNKKAIKIIVVQTMEEMDESIIRCLQKYDIFIYEIEFFLQNFDSIVI